MAVMFKITGTDYLTTKFQSALSDKSKLNDALYSIAQDVVTLLQEYPPQTIANTPGRTYKDAFGRTRALGYYERGKGWWRPVKGKRSLTGNVGSRYVLVPNSQRLSQNWQVRRFMNKIEVKNSTTYVAYVQSSLMQAAIHANNGWRTADDAVQEVLATSKLETRFVQALTEMLQIN